MKNNVLESILIETKKYIRILLSDILDAQTYNGYIIMGAQIDLLNNFINKAFLIERDLGNHSFFKIGKEKGLTEIQGYLNDNYYTGKNTL